MIDIVRRYPYLRHLTACDISNRAICSAENNFKAHSLSVTLQCASVTGLPFDDGEFDMIILFGVLEHVVDCDDALSEIHRVLASKGEVCIATSSVFSLVYIAKKIRKLSKMWPYGFQRNYSPDGLRVELRKWFEVGTLSYMNTDFDFPFSAIVDRLIGLVFSKWGRYIILRATKK